jgi:hypothetical protein
MEMRTVKENLTVFYVKENLIFTEVLKRVERVKQAMYL